MARRAQIGRPGLARPARSVVRVSATPGPQVSSTTKRPTVPEPTITPELAKLGATMPFNFSIALLNGGKYAKQKTPQGDLFWIADPAATSVWLADEWGNGVRPGWAPSLRQLIGNNAINTTNEFKIYRKTRDIFDAHIMTDDAVKRALPEIQKKVQQHVSSWAQQKTVQFHDNVRVLMMDVLHNVALKLNTNLDEVKMAATLSAQWGGGVVADINASEQTKAAFAKGMAAREQLTTFYKKKLHSPDLPKGLAANMRDAFGVDNESTLNTCFAITFAGLETSSNSISTVIRMLAADPKGLERVKKEAADVSKKHNGLTTIAAQDCLAFTYAVIRESLRMTYAVGAVPKYATEALTKPDNAAELPAKCPFQAAWKAMSVLDPAVKGELNVWKPERWLDAKKMESWKIWQHPFGSGTRECPGARIMQAVAALTAVELATHYKYTVDANTTFSNGGAPINRLPGKIERA
eukprot:GHUV01000293.1.p1 GENE.GHUV01000293.1~~GHUV01000293.1.p1  ORF type:complete len:544 (+),score=122.24 GHUV01000293.1:239-1633(+)